MSSGHHLMKSSSNTETAAKRHFITQWEDQHTLSLWFLQLLINHQQ